MWSGSNVFSQELHWRSITARPFSKTSTHPNPIAPAAAKTRSHTSQSLALGATSQFLSTDLMDAKVLQQLVGIMGRGASVSRLLSVSSLKWNQQKSYLSPHPPVPLVTSPLFRVSPSRKAGDRKRPKNKRRKPQASVEKLRSIWHKRRFFFSAQKHQFNMWF